MIFFAAINAILRRFLFGSPQNITISYISIGIRSAIILIARQFSALLQNKIVDDMRYFDFEFRGIFIFTSNHGKCMLLTLLTWLCWFVVPSAVGGVFWISSCFCWWLGCDGEDETINGFALTFPLLWSLIATPLSPSLLWVSFCDCVTCCDTVTIASEDGDVVTCRKREREHRMHNKKLFCVGFTDEMRFHRRQISV